ncbi:hypothetical protein AAFC00_003461 [Neodothiora populina]|uniref:tRNA (adenine(58)-N(1))-methyltransferase non-catalytic subunit TRM6 n=1 Tax=Neodothiora populina TaxID=2781224 RepID=A0ABR3PE81_9PEZI
MHTYIKPGTHIILRLPSGAMKIVEAIPNTTISISKFGSVPVNLLLGRPYFRTFEIADKTTDGDAPRLRVVPTSELNAEVLAEDAPDAETAEEKTEPAEGFDIVADDGSVLMKNNRLTVDDASRQTLTMQEIEELKKAGTGSGKEIIEMIMKSHANLDEKTKFSLAKYTLRKTKKYMRRFTVLPVDVSTLAEYMVLEKEASRIMELREECIGLIGSWAHAHYGGASQLHQSTEGTRVGGGRVLVVDETGGLVLASLAEKMDLLYEPEGQENEDEAAQAQDSSTNGTTTHPQAADDDTSMQDVTASTGAAEHVPEESVPTTEAERQRQGHPKRKKPAHRHKGNLATTNTIHLIHANAQPNISMLKYFGYDPNNPTPNHPLHNHLKPLSWLQLLDPAADATYEEPEKVDPQVLETWKSGKRGAYYKKRRRWERCKSIVDETREGGFDSLVVASAMEPATILKHAVPLLRGAAHVVIYSPTIEPLTELMDLYSRDRKAAYIAHLADESTTDPPPEEDFPVDPRLLLAPTLQTSKVRQWQVLPGRTHPMMTGRGGAEGYIFTARKVVPVEGKIEARGKFSKKRKLNA